MARLFCKQCNGVVCQEQIWREVFEVYYEPPKAGEQVGLVWNGDRADERYCEEGDYECGCSTYDDLDEAVRNGSLEVVED